MSKHLLALRKKPKHVRNTISLVAAGVCTLPVFLYLVMGTYGTQVVAEADASSARPKPFETLLGQFKEQLASVQSVFDTEGPSPATTAPLREAGVQLLNEAGVRVVPQTETAASTSASSTVLEVAP